MEPFFRDAGGIVMTNFGRVLVTGGAGFLGSNLVLALLDKSEHVWVLDDLFTGSRAVVPDVANVTFIRGSVTDGGLLREILPQVDYVFHFAARNIVLSATQPESDFRVNVEGTVQLVLNCLPYKHQIKRIVVASTSSVYGSSQSIPTNEERYDVSVPYAASKMSAELLASAYGRFYGLPTTCLRFSNVYGPGQVSTNPYCGVVTKFMEAISKGVPLTIYGDGTQTRDFTFVDDAINATLMAAQSDETIGDVFNVGTGIETSVITLSNLIATIAQKNDYPARFVEKRSIDTVYRRCIDSTKLRRKTEWKPQHSLQEGLSITWEWFQHLPLHF
jgi:UDP-glucose 4-epimerase